MKTLIITILIGSLLLLSPPVSSMPIYEQPSHHTISININNFPANFARAYSAYRSSSFVDRRHMGVLGGLDITRNNYTVRTVVSTPEPSSLLVMVAGAGLVVLGFVSYRRPKKAKSLDHRRLSNLTKKQTPMRERR